ncbi:hypothetical protein H5410_030581 [Solanum commersonii]|uniref:CCHC-type domain-containing protein n=1 Tax=Solanum commersonii TaxID=4109 RepID=A0A9J5YEP3_SOLCO|nr:hypothetical protein H5410_030581 [Solanum commersonii]
MVKLRERSQLGDFCTQFGLPDTSTNSKKKKHRDSRYSNPDKHYRKKRSRYRSKEECDSRKSFRKSNRFTKNMSKRELANIRCYKCGNFDHIAPNCKFEKLKTLELDEEIHDKVYSFLYTSGSKSDYDSDSGSEEEIDLLGLSDSNQHDKINTCNACHGDICSCENDEFYKLQSQFEDLNINTITTDNVIELLKEVTDNNLREKIIQLVVNKTINNKGKNIVEENTLAKPFNLHPRQAMILGMMQIVTAHKWMDPPWITKGRGRGNNTRGRGRSSPGSSYGSSSNSPVIQRVRMSLINSKISQNEASSSVHMEDIPESSLLYAQL